MSVARLRSTPHSRALGAEVDLESLEELTGDAQAFAELEATLDRHGVVCVRTQRPFAPQQLSVFEDHFGVSATRGTRQPAVPGCDFLGDHSTAPKLDDGRPPKPAATDFIHIDILPNGPAAFGVHATLTGCSLVPMRFADMRSVYAAQPDVIKAKLAGLRARHTAPPRGDGSASPWTMQPIAARHPRTADALLLLPNRWDIQIEHLPEREAIALIRELWQITEASPAQLEIPLQPHTLVIWDNITCSHTNPRYARAPGRVVWFFNTLNSRAIDSI